MPPLLSVAHVVYCEQGGEKHHAVDSKQSTVASVAYTENRLLLSLVCGFQGIHCLSVGENLHPVAAHSHSIAQTAAGCAGDGSSEVLLLARHVVGEEAADWAEPCLWWVVPARSSAARLLVVQLVVLSVRPAKLCRMALGRLHHQLIVLAPLPASLALEQPLQLLSPLLVPASGQRFPACSSVC